MKESEYHDDGGCDFIFASRVKDKELRGQIGEYDIWRCPSNARWRHIPTDLCYCENHTKYYEGKIEAQWEPL